MLAGEALKIAEKLYPPGTWILPHPNKYFTEPAMVRGRLDIAEYYYGVCHQSFYPIWTPKHGFAKIVEKPEHSKFYGF